MAEESKLNPAEYAANEALNQVIECINHGKSFVFEAGAGAGKTYSLIHVLRYLIQTQVRNLARMNRKIACITYTNVAKNEIKARTDGNPIVISETIHSFCWAMIKDFQPNMRVILPGIGKWDERINKTSGIDNKLIRYDLGYPQIEEHTVWLGHDDVLSVMIELMKQSKFRTILFRRFPFIFIDEYQDTNKDFINAIKQYFIAMKEGPLIGLFGDHWQKIYGSNACGKAEHANLTVIEKKANFRSVKIIVECLNQMRKELPQFVNNPNSEGSIIIYHSNNWQGERRTGGHWDGDLSADMAHHCLEMVKANLISHQWDFSPERTKILMLTHNVLAEEQGYRNLADVFTRTESYIKKEDDYISYFVDVLEPVCNAFESHRYGEMFSILGGKTPILRNYAEKMVWTKSMETLISLRNTGTIGQIIDHLQITRRPRLPEKIERKESNFSALINKSDADWSESDRKFVERFRALKKIAYAEVIALEKFIDNKTPFATKHGVKGVEFENVLVIIGRGWSQYNFGQMLEWVGGGIPKGKQDAFERNRNLFYVACSRSKKRLALLFTQKLSTTAIEVIAGWFGSDTINALDV